MYLYISIEVYVCMIVHCIQKYIRSHAVARTGLAPDLARPAAPWRGRASTRRSLGLGAALCKTRAFHKQDVHINVCVCVCIHMCVSIDLVLSNLI